MNENAIPGVKRPLNSDSSVTSRVLLNRIGSREVNRLQAEFLLTMSKISLSNDIALRGANAIHGVWLHGRSSRDLDFLAPADVKEQFIETITGLGFNVKENEDEGVSFIVMRGKIFKNIAIIIDICERPRDRFSSVKANFTSDSGMKIPVNVMPLSALMAEKLRASSMRSQPLDFFDLWLFSKNHQHLFSEIQDFIDKKSIDGDPFLYSARLTWENLLEAEGDWEAVLATRVPKVPDFQLVRTDLQNFFGCFRYP